MRAGIFLPILFLLFHPPVWGTDPPFEKLRTDFINGYTELDLPYLEYDYKRYFSLIPSIEKIKSERKFFKTIEKRLSAIEYAALNEKQRIDFKTIRYEAALNLVRLELEENWISEGRKIPVNGLNTIPHNDRWYRYFIRKFTSTNISPEEVFRMGKAEVARVQGEIERIRNRSAYGSDSAFYRHLKDDRFFLTDKAEIIERFMRADSAVRRNLSSFIAVDSIPPVYAMEWPDAGPTTPPGMYLSSAHNAYGKDVFLFNHYNGRYNYRLIDWLYMHEAVPGHHLQSSLRKPNPLLDLFLYPGNFEGWSCYIEYYGKQLGVYNDLYSELGKWEWDLVRSVRLVLDAGIHYYGWSREDALNYWKENIPGQDDIADREITRVTNWAGQALSYKVGADFIFQLQEKWTKEKPGRLPDDLRKQYLSLGMVPLSIVPEFIH